MLGIVLLGIVDAFAQGGVCVGVGEQEDLVGGGKAFGGFLEGELSEGWVGMEEDVEPAARVGVAAFAKRLDDGGLDGMREGVGSWVVFLEGVEQEEPDAVSSGTAKDAVGFFSEGWRQEGEVSRERAEVGEALGGGLCLELLEEQIKGVVRGEREVIGCFGDL